jgi:DNA-binding protein HU-beta
MSTLKERETPVNKSDLVSNVAKASGLTKADAERAIDATFESITGALKKGDEVRLIGFGTFATARREATSGRNPRTGATIKIPAKTLPKFRAGKQLKEAVDR